MFAQAIRNRLQQLSETVMVILYDKPLPWNVLVAPTIQTFTMKCVDSSNHPSLYHEMCW